MRFQLAVAAIALINSPVAPWTTPRRRRLPRSPATATFGHQLQNMTKKWKIDGDDFKRRCRDAGAKDSTCFSCSSLQVNGDGRVQCYSG
ncbi:hypothetical protein CSPX01_08635 [Colletotrichum filicis]|nr:hypothetical protein CSPX01_08635 [Colletotrichum filicis]